MKRPNRRYRVIAIFTVLFLLALGITNAMAAFIVRTMPNGVASPSNVWDSKPYTWAGNELQLWGNVTYDGAAPLTYTWDFGDGSSTSGDVANFDNIAVTHTYQNEGTPVATLTVSDGTDSVSSSVIISVVPHTAEVDKNLAVQRALKNLYNTRIASNINGCGDYFWNSSGYTTGETGLALLAFEDYGHRASNDSTKDIYADTVQRGLDYLFVNLDSQPASANPPYDSDINNNGKALYDSTTGEMYQQGIITMAIANTATPAAVVGSCGSSAVQGMTYQDVLTDLVDYIAFAQEDTNNCSGYGGWRYGANFCDSDNSVSQWPVLGLAAAAGDPWKIAAPSFVKNRLQSWLNYSQNPGNGGFGYDGPYSYPNIAKTGAGIIAMVYAGSGGNQANALAFLNNDWLTPNYGWLWENNIGEDYAMYAVKKGLQFAQISKVGSHDWQAEYDDYLVNNQYRPETGYNFDDYYEGGFPGHYWFGDGPISSAFGLLIMAQGLAELPPVAVAGLNQEVFRNKPVSFDGTGSYHRDPARKIVGYEWDFNYNGTTFNPMANGAKVTNSAGYPITNGQATQNYTVALRVTDDSTPPRTAVGTVLVTVKSGNIAPVANAGGPYVCAAGGLLTLDGSKSYDPNDAAHCSGDSCLTPPDYVATYTWNLGGAIYNGVKPAITCGTTIGTQNISLTVTDSFGVTSTQSTSTTTVAISDLQPFCYKQAPGSPTYNRITKRYTYTWQMQLKNKGTGAASSAIATLTSSTVPGTVTVIDNNLHWGSVPASSTVPSSDTFTYSYVGTGPDLSKMTWDFTYTDAGGTNRFVGSVPQNSLICK